MHLCAGVHPRKDQSSALSATTSETREYREPTSLSVRSSTEGTVAFMGVQCDEEIETSVLETRAGESGRKQKEKKKKNPAGRAGNTGG